jgi:fatty acid desaturase
MTQAPSATAVAESPTDWSRFSADLDAVISTHRNAVSRRDLDHAVRFNWLGRTMSLAGYALAAWQLNPLSPLLVVMAQMGRWGLAHQILHRSYDRLPGCPRSLNSSTFARGWYRYWDWCDWIIPAAWQHEHNVHHVHTGGPQDPDVVEANVDFLRSAPYPLWRKAAVALLIMTTWRWSYYAPSTFIQLRRHERGLPPTTYTITGLLMFAGVFNPRTEEGREFWRRCILPYALLRFCVIPLAALPFGVTAALNVLMVAAVAEVLLNFYSWALIASSHTGADLFRFAHQPRTRGEWYVHQVLGTANYSRVGSFGSWTQAWVNYQIEHHLCPNLPLLTVQNMSREIELVCLAHGVRYACQPLWRRFINMGGVVLGRTSMRWARRDADDLAAVRLSSSDGH